MLSLGFFLVDKLIRVRLEMHSFRHAGLEEPAPYLLRGHPDVVPMKVGNHLEDLIPVFTENPGFPALAGNDNLFGNL